MSIEIVHFAIGRTIQPFNINHSNSGVLWLESKLKKRLFKAIRLISKTGAIISQNFYLEGIALIYD